MIFLMLPIHLNYYIYSLLIYKSLNLDKKISLIKFGSVEHKYLTKQLD